MCIEKNQEFLKQQLITYIGNKRSLLPFIGKALSIVRKELSKQKLVCADLFSGSGIVARYLKQFSSSLLVNDLELYSFIINKCYLSNPTASDLDELKAIHEKLITKTEKKVKDFLEQRQAGKKITPGFISELYAPMDIKNIQADERCFYTPRNACYIDVMRQLIDKEVPSELRPFFIAPLLSEASVHANTAGIFKGFYKNSQTHKGQFGGNGQNALSRILGDIKLPFPVFSSTSCPFTVFKQDANELVLSSDFKKLSPFDIVYIDPPYNQHPYGSNYFMLNLIADYVRPDQSRISHVSGIPPEWNRSDYNKKHAAAQSFLSLVSNLDSKYILVSFNSEGHISKDEMINLLSKCGKVRVLESDYNTFRGSRNLNARDIHVKEYLFLVRKS